MRYELCCIDPKSAEHLWSEKNTSIQTQREKHDIKISQTVLECDKRDRDEFGNGNAKAEIKKNG